MESIERFQTHASVSKFFSLSFPKLDAMQGFWWNHFRMITSGSAIKEITPKNKQNLITKLHKGEYSEFLKISRGTIREAYHNKDYDRLMKAVSKYFILTDRRIEKNTNAALHLFDNELKDLLSEDVSDAQVPYTYDLYTLELIYYMILYAQTLRIAYGEARNLFDDPALVRALELYKKNLRACKIERKDEPEFTIAWTAFVVRQNDFPTTISELLDRLANEFDERLAIKTLLIINAIVTVDKALKKPIYQSSFNLKDLGFLLAQRIWMRSDEIKFRPKMLGDLLIESYQNAGQLDELQSNCLRYAVEPDQVQLLTHGLSEAERELAIAKVFALNDSYGFASIALVNILAKPIIKKQSFEILASAISKKVCKLLHDNVIPAFNDDSYAEWKYQHYLDAVKEPFDTKDPFLDPDNLEVLEAARRDGIWYLIRFQAFINKKVNESELQEVLAKGDKADPYYTTITSLLLACFKIRAKLLPSPNKEETTTTSIEAFEFAKDLLDFLDNYVPYLNLEECKDIFMHLPAKASDLVPSIIKGSFTVFLEEIHNAMKSRNEPSKSTSKKFVRCFENYSLMVSNEFGIKHKEGRLKKEIMSSTFHFLSDWYGICKVFPSLAVKLENQLLKVLCHYNEFFEKLFKESQNETTTQQRPGHRKREPDTEIPQTTDFLFLFALELSKVVTGLKSKSLYTQYLQTLEKFNMIDECINGILGNQASKEEEKTSIQNKFRPESFDYAMLNFSTSMKKRFDLLRLYRYSKQQLENVYLPQVPEMKLAKFAWINEQSKENLCNSILIDTLFYNSSQYYLIRFFVTIGQMFFERSATTNTGRIITTKVTKQPRQNQILSMVSIPELTAELSAKNGIFMDIRTHLKDEVQDEQLTSFEVFKVSALEFVRLYSQVMLILYHTTEAIKHAQKCSTLEYKHQLPVQFTEHYNMLASEVHYLHEMISKVYPGFDNLKGNAAVDEKKFFYFLCWQIISMLGETTLRILDATYSLRPSFFLKCNRVEDDFPIFGWSYVDQGITTIGSNLTNLIEKITSKRLMKNLGDDQKVNDDRRILISTFSIQMTEEKKNIKKKKRRPGKMIGEEEFLKEIDIKYVPEYTIRERMMVSKDTKLADVKARLFNEKSESEMNWNPEKLEQTNCFLTVLMEFYLLFMRIWSAVIPHKFDDYVDTIKWCTDAELLSEQKKFIDAFLKKQYDRFVQTKKNAAEFLRKNNEAILKLKEFLEDEVKKFGSSKRLDQNIHEAKTKAEHYLKTPFETMFASIGKRYVVGNQENLKWFVDFIEKRATALSFLNFDHPS